MAIGPHSPEQGDPYGGFPPKEDYISAAHRRALEEGSGASPYLAGLVTGPASISGAVEPPSFSPRNRRKRLPLPFRLVDGDSGLDPNWAVGAGERPWRLSDDKKADYRDGVALLREALTRAGAIADTPLPAVRQWNAGAKLVEELQALNGNPRASFLPASHAEKTAALRYLPMLNPNQGGVSGIPGYLSNIAAYGAKLNPDQPEAGRESKLNSAAMWLDDARQSQQTLAGFYRHLERMPVGNSLKAVIDQLPPDEAESVRLCIARHMAVDSVLKQGSTPLGTDPLRLVRSIDGKNKTSRFSPDRQDEKVAAYAEEVLSRLTVEEAIALWPFIQRNQTNRTQFWLRVLNEAGEDGKAEATAILNKYA